MIQLIEHLPSMCVLYLTNLVWWWTPGTPTLGKQRWVGQKFQVIFSYTVYLTPTVDITDPVSKTI